MADFETGPNPFLRAIAIVQANPYFGIVRASRDSLPSTQSSSLDLKKLETTQIPRRIREKDILSFDCSCSDVFPGSCIGSTTDPRELRWGRLDRFEGAGVAGRLRLQHRFALFLLRTNQWDVRHRAFPVRTL